MSPQYRFIETCGLLTGTCEVSETVAEERPLFLVGFGEIFAFDGHIILDDIVNGRQIDFNPSRPELHLFIVTGDTDGIRRISCSFHNVWIKIILHLTECPG